MKHSGELPVRFDAVVQLIRPAAAIVLLLTEGKPEIANRQVGAIDCISHVN
jgi:hypothetical protein